MINLLMLYSHVLGDFFIKKNWNWEKGSVPETPKVSLCIMAAIVDSNLTYSGKHFKS